MSFHCCFFSLLHKGEINYSAKREAVDLLNLMDHLNEEKPILLDEMKSLCLFLLEKIKTLEKPACIGSK